jgi:hypothetical protein
MSTVHPESLESMGLVGLLNDPEEIRVLLKIYSLEMA